MFAILRKAVLLVLASQLLVPVAAAQNNRSAVSVTGSDAASCTVPDPCRTFGVALSKTNSNGEVVALTSGGYGPFTINKPAIIVAAPGIYAALVAASGGDAIHVNAGASAKVVIRGLHLYGMGVGEDGISVTGSSEEVHVENCVINGFAGAGIQASLNVRVSDTTVRRCQTGIRFEVFGTVVKGTINRVEVRDVLGQAVLSSVFAGGNANVTVRDSVAADCSTGFDTAGVGAQLNIDSSLATNNSGAGIRAENGATVRVSNTMVTDNGFAGFLNSSSTFISWGNNKVRGNGTDTMGTITVVSQD